jgi:pyridinium-3,5-bisthiocarboxylic acid mononucleotide nickel chelatase
MKIAYLDIFAGISGDMLLGAALDAGIDRQAWLDALESLNLDGVEIEFEHVKKHGIAALQVQVQVQDESHHRNYRQVCEIIEAGDLPESVVERSAAVFQSLAQAEAAVHKRPWDSVHFHEVGQLDAIVDVVGAVLAFEMLEPDRVQASPVPLGRGLTRSAHGPLPLPAPAVLQLLEGIPVVASPVAAETVTPTGAALLACLADSFGPMPDMTPDTVGYGAGTREDAEVPNLLRLIIGQTTAPQPGQPIVELAFEVDDSNPEWLGHLWELVFELGALDMYYTPVQMKKGRPGTLVTVLAPVGSEQPLCNLLTRETTTLGVRVQPVRRWALPRQVLSVETEYGVIRVKVAAGLAHSGAPEFEDCRQAALTHGVPLREVYAAAMAAARTEL